MTTYKHHFREVGILDDKAPQCVAELFKLSDAPVIQSTQAIKQEMYDLDLYRDMLDFSPVLKDIVVRGNNSLATFDNLAQDIYLALLKLKPELNPVDEIKPAYLLNRQLMANMLENEDFQRMHGLTRLDSVAAGMGAQVLAEKTLELIEQKNNEYDHNGTADNGDTLEQLRDLVKHQFNGSDNTGNASPERIKEVLNLSQEDLTNACRHICQSASEEIADTLDMGKTWGIEPGNPNVRISYHSKRKALERLRSSPKLKELADLVGRLRQVAIRCWKKSSNGASSVNDVTVGGNLEQLLPSEKMLLTNNTTRKDFFRRYHQQELLQYRSDGVYPKARGPMVVCCDVSGSMRGKAEQWSKAMAIALAEVALREKRDFACILFDSQIVETGVIPRGMWDPNTLINIAEKFTGGGTSFIYPLEKSMELIRTSRFNRCALHALPQPDGQRYATNQQVQSHRMPLYRATHHACTCFTPQCVTYPRSGSRYVWQLPDPGSALYLPGDVHGLSLYHCHL
jgi:uncharacterized protein with von Willebrand factor type A (vWA) domain